MASIINFITIISMFTLQGFFFFFFFKCEYHLKITKLLLTDSDKLMLSVNYSITGF